MPLNVYDPCPCGSGKKLKFCCAGLAGEMEKIGKLRQNNQPHVALRLLEELAACKPGNPWVVTSRAAILLNAQQAGQAKALLEEFLENNPDHIFGLALHATASFMVDGFELAKQAVHLAFQRCADANPEMTGGLAMGIAGFMLASGRHMASRQHLALAMRLMPERERQDIFLHLLEFDSNTDLAYPLRSVHPLADYSGLEESENEATTAARLSELGCFEPAARLFDKLAEQEPDNAALWQNVGLCRAWDGDETAAAEALHLAARLQSDFPTAIECETVAQLLDQKTDEDSVKIVSLPFRVQSVSKLLTLLTEHDRLVRIETRPQAEDDEQEAESPAGLFLVLDRSEPTDPPPSEPLTLDSVANVLAQLNIFDANNDEPAQAYLMGFVGEPLDVARDLLLEAAGTQVEADKIEDEEDLVVETVPQELVPFCWRWHFPQKTPVALRRNLERQKWQNVITQVWPETRLTGLGGKTPLEVAGDPEQKVPLTAALFALDAYCNRRRHVLDVDLLRERLQLDDFPQIEVAETTPLNSFSAMRLQWLPVGRLSDAQLSHTLNRSLLIHHGTFLYKVLTEVLSRPSCVEQVDLNRVYVTLVELCHDQYKRDEALQWIEKGRQFARTQENAFEHELQWEMRELSLRLEDPNDPALNPLLKHIGDTYGTKLPQIRDHLHQLLDAFGVQDPWQPESPIVTAPGGAGSTTEGGIWTPAATQQSQDGEKKLWLPGQD